MKQILQFITKAALVVALIIILILGLKLRRYNNPTQSKILIQSDTLYIKDTITIEKPIYISYTIIDTIAILVKDTTIIHDTTYINLPIEQRHYEEADYEAWISGYRPNLDSLKIFNTSTQIQNTYKVQKPPKFSIGIQAGYGINYSNQNYSLGPYIGIGLNYRFSF